jgi:tetratricopeptide (TPR) repeat protein
MLVSNVSSANVSGELDREGGMRWPIATAGLAGIMLVTAIVHAAESNGTPAAKALLAHGEAAARQGKLADAAEAFRKALRADPDFVEAHQRFIEATGWLEDPASRTPTVPRLQALYEKWAKQHPAAAVYQWGLGFLSQDADAADAFYNKALALDPLFARAHVQLAKNADLRGDWNAQREHLSAAVKANPDEPRYLMKYAHALKRVDAARFRELANEVVRKFPRSQAAAEALYRLAEDAPRLERRAYLERLRAEYPPDTFSYGATAMYDLYDELTDPAAALSVAQQMAKASASKTWARRVAVQEAMSRAQSLVVERKFGEALQALDRTERPTGAHAATWTLLKAQAAAGAGRAEQAYDVVLEAAATTPDDRLTAALAEYGAALKKTASDTDGELWKAREQKSVAATAFALPSSRDARSVRLADFRGRVVLLAFWFPG